jgi:amidase
MLDRPARVRFCTDQSINERSDAVAVRRIRREELQQYAAAAGFTMSDDEVAEYDVLTSAIMTQVEAFDALPTEVIEPAVAVREPGRRPTAEEDPYNAVIRWCRVSTDDSGPLSGKRIGLKDNIAVAGVPMTCGSRILADYVPREDAVVVDRILRAGGEVVAKLNMDSFAWSGGGDSSDYGPTRTPHDLSRTASGSSGGSGAALYLDDVDITLGTDQGGSIRYPASWCGVLGLKPTHSLVPYSGIVPLDPMFDHVGPLARTVEDLALLLEVVAGPSPLDQRQYGVEVQEYRRAVDEAPDSLAGVRVGVIREGFMPDGPESHPGTAETNHAVREAAQRFAKLGAEVTEISLPEKLIAAPIMFTSFAEGFTNTVLTGGNGYGHDGYYSEDLALALGKGLRSMGDDLPPIFKLVHLMGMYLHENYYGSFYAKAKRLKATVRRAVDAALDDYDVLVMPTTDHYPHEYKPPTTVSEDVLYGWTMVSNGGVFDITGHPSLSMPAAEADGLPVGVMVTGRRFDDASLLSFARTYEKAYGWLPAGR